MEKKSIYDFGCQSTGFSLDISSERERKSHIVINTRPKPPDFTCPDCRQPLKMIRS